MALTRSLSNSVGHKSSVQTLLENKIETYLERKYRISRSHATRDSYRIIVSRFVNFIQLQYKQDFEQFLSSLKQSDNSKPTRADLQKPPEIHFHWYQRNSVKLGIIAAILIAVLSTGVSMWRTSYVAESNQIDESNLKNRDPGSTENIEDVVRTFAENPSFGVTIEKDVYFVGENAQITVYCPDEGNYSPQFGFEIARNGIPQGAGGAVCRSETRIMEGPTVGTGNYTYTIFETEDRKLISGIVN